jgi:hypothetical protein
MQQIGPLAVYDRLQGRRGASFSWGQVRASCSAKHWESAMTDVVELLERVGGEACFHDEMDSGHLTALAAQIEEPLRAALLAGNAEELRMLMGQRPMVAMIMPAEEEEEEEQGEEPEAPEQQSAASRLPAPGAVVVDDRSSL